MLLIRTLSFLVNIYMMIIFIRIVLTWFSWLGRGGLQDLLARITDPYLNWFRRFPFLRIGFLDLSPVAALGILSLVNRILSTLVFYGKITVGVILTIVLQAIWGALSFLLGFLIIVLILRLIAFLIRANNYSPFWRIVETISQPVLFWINRTIFKDRIVNFLTSLIISITALGFIYVILRILVSIVSGMLLRLPI